MMLKIGSLFSGYGGLDLAVKQVFDAHTAWVSDIDPGACRILAHRFPDVPNLGDITTIDWAQVEPVDIITGGSPCLRPRNPQPRAPSWTCRTRADRSWPQRQASPVGSRSRVHVMCLPDGWVTDVPGITRSEALKALGNGVAVPQAVAALRLMVGRLGRTAS